MHLLMNQKWNSLLTIYTREYDRITWTLKLKGGISHFGCKELEIIIVPISPIRHGKTNISFWIITHPTKGIFGRYRALRQAYTAGIPQFEFAILQSTLINLIRILPISELQFTEARVGMFVPAQIPFVVQSISKPGKSQCQLSQVT